MISGDQVQVPGVPLASPEGENFDPQGTFGRKLRELLERNQEMIQIMEADKNRQKKKSNPRCRNRLIQRHYMIFCLMFFFWGGGGDGARALFSMYTS